MARSVLASTRSIKKDRRRIHHAERSRVKRALHDVVRHQLEDEGIDVEPVNPLMRMQLAYVVERRRTHDKASPLGRWARRRLAARPELADAPIDDQLRYFATILPAGLVGQHALSHVEFSITGPYRFQPTQAQRRELEAEIGAAARFALDDGRHAELNAHLRRVVTVGSWRLGLAAQTEFSPRQLGGYHDLEAFARDAAGTSVGFHTVDFAAQVRRTERVTTPSSWP